MDWRTRPPPLGASVAWPLKPEPALSKVTRRGRGGSPLAPVAAGMAAARFAAGVRLLDSEGSLLLRRRPAPGMGTPGPASATPAAATVALAAAVAAAVALLSAPLCAARLLAIA